MATSLFSLRALALIVMMGLIAVPAYSAARPRETQAQAVARGVVDELAERIPGEIVVKYRTTVSDRERRALLSDYELTHASSVEPLGIHVLRAVDGQELATIRRLQTDPRVELVEPSYRSRASAVPFDPLYSQQYGMGIVGMEQAWDLSTGQNSIITAVIDTGIDFAHPDLDTRIVNLSGSGLPGADHVFLTSPSSACPVALSPDDDGWRSDRSPRAHGTHVAGIVAAESTVAGFAPVGVAGVAPASRIAPLKAVDCDGVASNVDIDRAIVFAADRGVSVINLSVSTTQDFPVCPAADQQAIDYAHSKGVVIVAAAGNAGTGARSEWTVCNHVIGVGATTQTDSAAAFSQRNNTVDLSAPGADILSTYRDPNGTHVYRGLDGTSQAAAHVAGCVALIRSIRPTFSPEQVEQVLRATAVDLGAPGRDDTYGTGRLNCAAAVLTVAGPVTPPSPTTPTTPGPTATLTPTPAPPISCAGVIGLGGPDISARSSTKQAAPSAPRTDRTGDQAGPRAMAGPRGTSSALADRARGDVGPGPGWQTITCETFEGDWRAPNWFAYDFDNPSAGDYCWAPTPFQARHGYYSAWPAAGCQYALNAADYFYPSDFATWLIYGPFSLTDAAEANVRFSLWHQMGSGDDLFLGASIDGANLFYGEVVQGSSTDREPPTADGWRDVLFDLTNVYNLGNLTGQPSVYVGWLFRADTVGTDDGPFLDDVLIEKRVGSSQTTPTATRTPTRTSSPSPTPTRTATISPTSGQPATLNGTVSLQGLTAGTSNYQVLLDVQLFQPGSTTIVATYTAATDVNGAFSVVGIPAGTYDVAVKEVTRIGRVARGLVLGAGPNARAFGELLAGDVNGDDVVSLADYSALRASFGKCIGDAGYLAEADFTGDSCVTVQDYARLRANYGLVGPLNAP